MGMPDAMTHGAGIITTKELENYNGPTKTVEVLPNKANPTLKEIDKEIKKSKEDLAKLMAIKTSKMPNKTIVCMGSLGGSTNSYHQKGKGCQKRARIGNLIYIQTNYYVEPHGCMGGDYWRKGEGKYVCPFCGTINRLSYREEVVELKEYFKEVLEIHREEWIVCQWTSGKKKGKNFPMLKDDAKKQGIL